MVDLALVESVPSLALLSEPAKQALAQEFDEVNVSPGERIVRQGDFAYELFAILKGRPGSSRTARSSRRSGRATSVARSASS